MVILCRDKNLLITKSSPVFKFETGVDHIRILVPQFYEGRDLATTRCVVEVERPYVEPEEIEPDEDTTTLSDEVEIHVYEDERGKWEKIFKYFKYEEETYKEGYLSVVIPITTALTRKEGEITIWLMFMKYSDETSELADCVLKTNSTSFIVNPSDALDSESEDIFDEVWRHTGIDALMDAMDNLIKIEIEDEDEDIIIDIDDEDEPEEPGEDVTEPEMPSDEDDTLGDDDSEEETPGESDDDDADIIIDDDDEEGA